MTSKGQPRRITRASVGSPLQQQRLVGGQALEITVSAAWSFGCGRSISLAARLAHCLSGVRLLPELPGDAKSVDF
jgi:hypothetical protein